MPVFGVLQADSSLSSVCKSSPVPPGPALHSLRINSSSILQGPPRKPDQLWPPGSTALSSLASSCVGSPHSASLPLPDPPRQMTLNSVLRDQAGRNESLCTMKLISANTTTQQSSKPSCRGAAAYHRAPRWCPLQEVGESEKGVRLHTSDALRPLPGLSSLGVLSPSFVLLSSPSLKMVPPGTKLDSSSIICYYKIFEYSYLCYIEGPC